jgi:hypothetical protein
MLEAAPAVPKKMPPATQSSRPLNSLVTHLT